MNARKKIRSLDDLALLSEQAKGEGKTVVLAHGVFDLLHVGHIRHLEAARNAGDVLMVTITADAFVNKGPNRPAFGEQLRAEAIASLGYVDYVGVNAAPTAENVLNAIRPSVFVKGSDYANPDDDVTGKIVAEREMVEKHGGRILFTEDITFSSTELINAHMPVHEPHLQSYLQRMRDSGALARLNDLVDGVEGLKVLMIGETIIDEYRYVSSIGKAAKEPILATLYQSNEVFAGGVVAAANHLAGFGADIDIVTFLGDQDPMADAVREQLNPQVTLKPFTFTDRPTIRKVRYVDPQHVRKLFQVYHMVDAPVPAADLAPVLETVRATMADYDLVIVCDFGHGLMQPAMIETLGAARFCAVNAQSNSGNMGFNPITKYAKADFVCIDGFEARMSVHDNHSSMDTIVETQLAKLIDCPRILVTLSRAGSVAWSPGHGIESTPAFSQNPVDTMGAGDAFFVVAAAVSALGASVADAALVGNVVGGLKIGTVGHRRAVDKVSVLRTLASLLR